MNYSGPKHERLGSIFSECDIFQEPIQSHLGAHLGQSIRLQLGQLRSYREDLSFNLFIMRAVILRGEGVHPARKQFVFINRKRVVGAISGSNRTLSTQHSSRSYCQTD
jgi:hypothetical protein